VIRVRSPNGTIIQFPDGTPTATINSVMAAHYSAQGPQQRALADARQQVQQHGADGSLSLINGYTMGFGPEFAGAGAAVETGLDNLGRRLAGKPLPYGMSDSFSAEAQAYREQMQRWADQHPAQALAANLSGAALNPVNAAGGRFVAAGGKLLPTMARGVAVGAATGAAYGAGEAGPGHRAHGAAQGAFIGGLAGGVAPPAIGLGEKGAGLAMDAAHNVRRALGAADPASVARRRLANMLAKDIKAGANPQAAASSYAGVSQPTVADVGGENVRALIRDAGSQGPARQQLQAYRDQVATDLQNHALAITAKLTPGETRTPQQLADALETQRAQNASVNYAAPYSARIDLADPLVIQALRDPEGAQAISRAVSGARANMDYDAAADLMALKATAAGPTGNAQVWPTTGRALDRLQIALGNRGQQLLQGGSRDIAAGLFKRQALINGLLDDTPGLSEARGDYRNLSQQIDAIGHGQKVANATPSVLADLLQGASPEALGAAGVGARDALATVVGSPAAGATGALNRIATNTNTGVNMSRIFGPDLTDAWRSGIQAEAERMDNANFMAPNTASQTHSKGADELMHAVLHLPHAATNFLGAVLGGGPLSDPERAAIVSAGTSGANDDLLQALIAAKRPPVLSQIVPYAIPALAGTAVSGTAGH